MVQFLGAKLPHGAIFVRLFQLSGFAEALWSLHRWTSFILLEPIRKGMVAFFLLRSIRPGALLWKLVFEYSPKIQ